MDDSRFDHLARRLRAWGLNQMAAAVLEMPGPWALLGVQALYFAQPWLEPFAADNEIGHLADLLEDPAALHAFAKRLGEEAA